MELNKQEKPESGAGNQDFLALDFELQNNKGKFPGSPVPDASEIARAMLEQRSRPAVSNVAAEPQQEAPAVSSDAAATPAVTKVAAPVPAITDVAPAAPVQMSAPAAPPPAMPEAPEEVTATSWIRKRKKGGNVRFCETASIGKILQEARISCGMTVKEVEAATRIRAVYIELLERDAFKELPPPVYVRAYIRNMCNLYSLDKTMLDEIMQHHYNSKQDHVISEEIYHQLEKDKQTNVEEEARIKRMILMVAGGATALLVLIIGSIFFMVSAARAPKSPPSEPAGTQAVVATTDATRFDQEAFERLRVPRTLEMEKINASSAGASSSSPRRK